MTTIPTESQFDQLMEEFLDRHRRGEKPNVREYVDRHPEWAASIEQFFPAVAVMEELGTVLTPASSSASTNRPTKLGEYRIVREIGRGGMGVVYEAVQESLGRHVALKVLPPGQFSSGVPLQRFVREAQTAARLHHTNIVPVFGVGADQGTYFFAMQYIQGHGLDVVLQEIRQLKQTTGHLQNSPTVAESSATLIVDRQNSSGIARLNQQQYYRNIARLMMQAADALAYAHAHGVLHRDIKPSNLILDVHSTLWITDFGLAKSEGSENLSRTGDVIGTLRYMAPERFQGICTERSDVYSLGATLYEMVTMKSAFSATDKLTLLDDIQHGRCSKPKTIDASVPADLELIICKAMAQAPQDRYSSAAELGEDLQRFLEDRAIVASRPSVYRQLSRWARKRPGLATSLAFLLVSFLVVSVLSFSLWTASSQLRHSLLNAQSQNERANRNLEQLNGAIKEILDGIRHYEQSKGEHHAELRKTLLRLSIPYQKYVISQQEGQKRTVYEQITAHQDLATIYREDEKVDQAEAELQKALTLSRKQAADQPEDPEALVTLAMTLHHMGVNQDRRTRVANTGNDSLAEALQIAGRGYERNPQFNKNTRLLISLLMNQANSQQESKQVLALIERAAALAGKLVTEPDANDADRLVYAMAINRLADLKSRQSSAGINSATPWTDAERVIKQMLEGSPNTPELRAEWAFLLENRGLWFRRNNQLEQSAADHDQAISMLSPLVKEFPYARFRVKLAGAYCNRAIVYNKTKQYSQALALLDRAAEEIEFILLKDPQRALARQFGSVIYNQRAIAHQMLGQFQHTASNWHRSVSLSTGQARLNFQAQEAWALAMAKDYPPALLLVKQLKEQPEPLSRQALIDCAAVLCMSRTSPTSDSGQIEEIVRLLTKAHQEAPFTQDVLKNDNIFKNVMDQPAMKAFVNTLPSGSTKKP